MTDPIQAAIEKAEEACPCRIFLQGFGGRRCGVGRGKTCECVITPEGMRRKPRVACVWPGHAAIRSLASTCIEQAVQIPDEWTRHPSCERGEVCTHIRMGAEVARRIRALLPESREEPRDAER